LYPFSRTRSCSRDNASSFIFPIFIIVFAMGITYMEAENYHLN
jgi:hypothetical protein